MSGRLVIIGARAMGREACVYAHDAGLEVKGFLDSNASALDGYEGYPAILGPVESYQPAAEDRFVVALGDPEWKLRYADMITEKG